MKRLLFSFLTRLSMSPITAGLLFAAAEVGAGCGSAQRESGQELAVLTRFEVNPEHLHTVRKLIGTYVGLANEKEENIMAEAFYEEDSASVLWIMERWESRTAFADNKADRAFREFQQVFPEMLMRSPDPIYIKDLEPVSKEQWNAGPANDDQPITIMLFVDARPGTERTFRAIYHAAMPQFRSEPGVINYQLSQLLSDSTQFVTYEKFRNEEAFQYHLRFPPIQPVIDYLNTNIKKKPFQTGLHRLVEFAPLKRE